METLLVALAVAAAAAAVSIVLALSGWLPRLAGRAVYVVECLFETGDRRSRLTPKDRAELAARLWVPL